MARAVAAAIGLVFVSVIALGAGTYAWADNALQDVTRAPAAPASSGLGAKFEGSTVEGSTYVGSGSFYTSGYRDPYASIALFARPTYRLGTKYKLSLNARIYVEEELTTPDNPVGRRFYPYDPWLWLSAGNLRTFERAKIRIGGVFRTVIPISYESRYQHMVTAFGVGLNANRQFEFGHVSDEARKWVLLITYTTSFVKYFQTSEFRGSGPGDTTGCLAPPSAGAPGISGGGGPSGSAADRCGGPANANFALVNGGIIALTRGKWSGAISLSVSNTFNYAFPQDAVAADNSVPTGRSDSTWGIISLSYQLQPHTAVSAGLSSFQPALDSRYQNLRFPFFDLSGGANYHNYTQVFLSVSGSL